MTKGVDEKIDEGFLRWFGHVEKMMENDRITKRVYVGECAGTRSVGRRIDTVKDCLKERGLDVRGARRMVQDRCMAGVCEGECMGRCPRDEPLTLTRCQNCEFPYLMEPLKGGGLCVAELST